MLLQFATKHSLPQQTVVKYSAYMRYICSPADDHKERLGWRNSQFMLAWWPFR
jgi:protoheme ferro-lyase